MGPSHPKAWSVKKSRVVGSVQLDGVDDPERSLVQHVLPVASRTLEAAVERLMHEPMRGETARATFEEHPQARWASSVLAALADGKCMYPGRTIRSRCY